MSLHLPHFIRKFKLAYIFSHYPEFDRYISFDSNQGGSRVFVDRFFKASEASDTSVARVACEAKFLTVGGSGGCCKPPQWGTGAPDCFVTGRPRKIFWVFTGLILKIQDSGTPYFETEQNLINIL